MQRFAVKTPRSDWAGGEVFGLGDPLSKAWIRGQTLEQWQQSAKLGSGEITGPAIIYGADTFATETMVQALAQVGATQTKTVRLARAPSGAGALCDPLQRLPRDSVGRILFDLWFVPAGVSANLDGDDPLKGAAPIDVDIRSRSFSVSADPEVSGSTNLELTFASATCGPVGHWVEVMRMNLLATGGQLMEATRGLAVRRYLWAALRAGSLDPRRAFSKLNLIAKDAFVHPAAVVELSVIGPGAQIGPGAIVRSSTVGAGAKISSQALCELATIGAGAHVQRKAMVAVSTLYPGARTGGIIQFGLCGEASAQKMFAVGTDMKLDGKVRTPTPTGLMEIDIGYLGVGFGHRSFVGSGVWIAPGRFVPNDARVARPVDLMVMNPGAD